MNAVIPERYGPPDVLELRQVEVAVPRDDEVLVRVRAASVHPDVWHVVRGRPYVLRLMGAGVRRPRQPIPGTDLLDAPGPTGPVGGGDRPGVDRAGPPASLPWRGSGRMTRAERPAIRPHAMRDQPEPPLHLTEEMAEHLHRFAFHCVEREYPNKPGHVLGGDADLRPPRELHPCFYGCFDWHSAVHGHWTLVTLLRSFPALEKRDAIVEKLRRTITPENVEREVRTFGGEHARTFERPYGWAWLLKLAKALRDWEQPVGAELHQALLPLERLIAERFAEFLAVLSRPVRAGTHANTAFALSLAQDYALQHDPALAQAIDGRARDYFLDDRGCPLTWEPGGFDFLSPCLEEASLMRKVLPADEFARWFEAFLPGFAERPGELLEPAEVADPSDGHLAHLDGLNFSRARCLFELGRAMGSDAMVEAGVRHFERSYARLDAREYAGSHWLATFATYALIRYGS